MRHAVVHQKVDGAMLTKAHYMLAPLMKRRTKAHVTGGRYPTDRYPMLVGFRRRASFWIMQGFGRIIA